MPKFVYLVQSLKIPQDTIKRIDSLIFKFLWHGKREKIKRTTLIGQKCEGGLDMCDTASFFKSLKLKWIKSLLNVEEANWKILPNYFLNVFGENFLIFYMNLDKLKHIENINTFFIPDFYTDIIQTWLEIKNVNIQPITTFERIRKQVIWGNKEIKYSNKCLVFNEWIKSDILFVNDVINDKGEIAENVIYNKLLNKSNWISEISKLKIAIPNSWKVILKSEYSLKCKVKTDMKIKIQVYKGKRYDLDNINNKIVYSELVNCKFSKPYVHTYWNTYFNTIIKWDHVYKVLHT